MAKSDYVTAREFDKLYAELQGIREEQGAIRENVANLNGRLTMTTTLISIGIGVISFFMNFFVVKKA